MQHNYKGRDDDRKLFVRRPTGAITDNSIIEMKTNKTGVYLTKPN
jgi:hypothetical protein